MRPIYPNLQFYSFLCEMTRRDWNIVDRTVDWPSIKQMAILDKNFNALFTLLPLGRAATSENVPLAVRLAKIQIRLRIRSALAPFWIVKGAIFLHTLNEDSNQPARMRRLIWVFVVRTCQKYVSSHCGLIHHVNSIWFDPMIPDAQSSNWRHYQTYIDLSPYDHGTSWKFLHRSEYFP